MSRYNLDFCEQYAYPPQVAGQLEAICDTVSETIGSRLLSLILFGSTSRGEFTCVRNNGSMIPWSDYEFLGVVDGRPRELNRLLAERLSELEQAFGSLSPLFHIDCSLVSLEELRKLPRIVRHFETKQLGKVLMGEDLRYRMPEVTAENIDLRDVNEILLWRYWSLVLYTPMELFDSEPNVERRTLYSYILCRNVQDIPTFLLPHLGVLIPGFRARQKWLQKNLSGDRPDNIIDDELIAFLDQTARGKLDLQFPDVIEDLVRDTAGAFYKARRLMCGRFNVNCNGEAPWRKIFKDHWTSRRKGFEILMMANGSLGLHATDAAWLAKPKHGLAFQALAGLFDSAASKLNGNSERAEMLLGPVDSYLGDLIPGYTPDACVDGPFSRRWAERRRWIVRFMIAYVPSLGSKHEYLSRLIDGL